MADEQAEELVETPTETTEESTDTVPDAAENVSEDEENSSEEPDRGDLRVALQQERQKRQQLEASLRDPGFVYQQARQLGLTEEEAQAAAQTPSQPQADLGQIVSSQVDAKLDYLRAVEMLPELKTDNNLAVWAAGLVDSGKTHSQAAKIIMKTLGKTQTEAKQAGAEEAKQTISAKERAQTVSQTSPSTSLEQDEHERLIKESRSADKTVARRAHLELIKQRLR